MIPIPLDAIIGAITDIVSPTAFIKDKLQRNETVIKLLKKFNLDPDHPPADFSGVYAYALVEYGVGKPKPFLTLTDRPYERMNITGVKGLTEAEKDTLKALGAVEDGVLYRCNALRFVRCANAPPC